MAPVEAPVLAETVTAWEPLQIGLTTGNEYDNPYADVDVWVDLEGPGFAKRVYGFWGGGDTFYVRVLGTVPGEWRWCSGSNQVDAGLNGQCGTLTVKAAPDALLAGNPNLRGIIKSTENGRALQYADGTPYFLLGDTWWTTPTNRFPWHEDDEPRAFGPDFGFKDMVQFRKEQGYNSVGIIAALPAWDDDGHPQTLYMEEEKKTILRHSWKNPETGSGYDVSKEGGRPFGFPGKVPGFEDVFPDMDRINPEYFHYMDRKIAYLWQNGFAPFIEVARRDASVPWKKFYDFTESYGRYINYVFARYHVYNALLSPIHFDTPYGSIPARDYNAPINYYMERYGLPPFGNLLTCNSSPSSLVNFGGHNESPWIGLHQTGNQREHDTYWYLTEIFRSGPAKPALNGEPYYAGYHDINFGYKFGAEGGSQDDDRYCRSGMYGSFLSGGLAGHIYGAEGLWAGDNQPEAKVKFWDAMQWESGDQLRHLKTFAFSEGTRYTELEPATETLAVSGTHVPKAYDGWAFAARTADRKLCMLYFEKGCPLSRLRGLLPAAEYEATWFDVRTGEWLAPVVLQTTQRELIQLDQELELPTDDDWALKLVYRGPAENVAL